MAGTEIEINESTVTVVPRAIIESKLSATANQMDIIAILLAEIGKKTDIDSNLIYTLEANEYARLKHYSNPKKAYQELKEKVCGDTCKHKLSFRHIGFDISIDGNTYEQYNWFSKITYDRGVVTFNLTPEMKEILVYLKKNDKYKVFTKLRYILPMSSQYSKRIYLMCREFLGSGLRYCDTDWDMFIDKLQIPSTYNYMKIKNVLDNAKKEIDMFTDITITYDITEETVRGGKRPLAIKFYINLNGMNEIYTPT